MTGRHGESEATLRRVRHLFVNRANMRAALRKLVNAAFAVRDGMWWGTGTACGSDSRKFGAWSSNLMTEWHQRYRGPGVMIYWHAERKSVCIYSQLKSCSASEAASMIEGVLRHCTDMEVDRQYTDTHGASIVGFTFAHMLGFKLMPRLTVRTSAQRSCTGRRPAGTTTGPTWRRCCRPRRSTGISSAISLHRQSRWPVSPTGRVR
ncbi:Tn3 family transposase [Streptomyces sp. NRRL F-2664]|uniref:Tn3 family transposase n=1 Tax=Streptomyces sp. NRRL F-2664 TaxID=1463842 RepID=UPI0004C7175C|nr:Tn3 family transposase [Streptomyces sp. NRRL F-2664]